MKTARRSLSNQMAIAPAALWLVLLPETTEFGLALRRMITASVVEDLEHNETNCVGVLRCEENRIEILSREAMSAVRNRRRPIWRA